MTSSGSGKNFSAGPCRTYHLVVVSPSCYFSSGLPQCNILIHNLHRCVELPPRPASAAPGPSITSAPANAAAAPPVPCASARSGLRSGIRPSGPAPPCYYTSQSSSCSLGRSILMVLLGRMPKCSQMPCSSCSSFVSQHWLVLLPGRESQTPR